MRALGCVLAITLLASTAYAQALQHPDVQVLADIKPAKQAIEQRVVSAIAAAAGGMFAVSLTEEHVPVYLKISSDGALEWRAPQPAPAPHESPLIAMNAGDGGYWVVGTAQSQELDVRARTGPGWVDRLAAVQYDYLRHIDVSGQPGPPMRLAPTPHMHFVYCGIEVADGYVLAGANGGGPALSPQVPWIEKVDRAGQRIWEKLFATDNGQEMWGQDVTAGCSGILSGTDGRITWATPVRTVEANPNSPEWAQALNDRQRNHAATFVVQFAADGTELARTRHYEVENALLVQLGYRTILIERISPMLHPAPRNATPDQIMQTLRELRRVQLEDLGVRLTTYDGSLREIDSSSARMPDFYEMLNAAYPTPDGGLLLSGCEQGVFNYLTFIDSGGRISPRRTWSSSGPQTCARVAFAPGRSREQVEMLSSDALSGVHIVTVRSSR